jgi:hypothetical protein
VQHPFQREVTNTPLENQMQKGKVVCNVQIKIGWILEKNKKINSRVYQIRFRIFIKHVNIYAFYEYMRFFITPCTPLRSIFSNMFRYMLCLHGLNTYWSLDIFSKFGVLGCFNSMGGSINTLSIYVTLCETCESSVRTWM